MIENKFQQPSFFEKLKKGAVVALRSVKFIWQHKKLLFFPLLTFTLIISALCVSDLIYYKLYHKHLTSLIPQSKTAPAEQSDQPTEETSQDHSYMGYTLEFLLFLYLFSFICTFFSAFSNVALSHATTQAFRSTPIKVGESLRHSMQQFLTLLIWSFYAIVAHALMALLSRIINKTGMNAFLSRLIGGAMGLAWHLATFLVIPVMAHENIGAFKSIKRSAELVKKTFGENVAVAFILPTLLAIGLISTVLLIIPVGGILFYVTNDVRVIFAIIVPLVVLLLTLIVISAIVVSAAVTVFQTAAYHYAIGSPVGPFHAEEVRSSFVAQKK